LADRRTKETYRAAGVDIDVGDKIAKIVGKQARSTFTPEVISDLGFFCGLFELKGYDKPILVSSADGVGTKLKIACAVDRHETIGVDLVHHCVNDILTCGAAPLFFQDYIAMAKLVPEIVTSIIEGMARSLSAVGCILIGGETAEMPGLYPEGEYDLVGFIVGVVEREKVINGKQIMALPSSGLHTNGYSLVRRVFHIDEDPSCLNRLYPQLDRPLSEKLLEPHRCYYPMLKSVLALIKGIAHITGGGIPGNLPRILPQGLAARIERGSWEIPPIFSLIQKEGNIGEREMYRVFNMGIGLALVCSPDNVEALIKAIPGARPIGEVTKQKGKQRIIIV